HAHAGWHAHACVSMLQEQIGRFNIKHPNGPNKASKTMSPLQRAGPCAFVDFFLFSTPPVSVKRWQSPVDDRGHRSVSSKIQLSPLGVRADARARSPFAVAG